MEGGSDEEGNKNNNISPADGSKKPKRQMKTPFQLETLERTYSEEMYPSEATRQQLSETLGLTDRQVQTWFCHRRLKDKEKREGIVKKPPPAGGAPVGRPPQLESSRDDSMVAKNVSDHSSRLRSRSESESRSRSEELGSESNQFDNVDDDAPTQRRVYEPSSQRIVRRAYEPSPQRILRRVYEPSPQRIVRRVYEPSPQRIARRRIDCVEAQLGGSLREDGPVLGIEFDELPPGAFGAPIGQLSARE